MYMRGILSFAISVLISSCLLAQNPGSVASLSSSHRQVSSPGTFNLLFTIDLQPSWHTYWKFAGDSGYGVQIDWTLPPGVTVHDPIWPIPERIDINSVINFGFHQSLQLVFPVSLQAKSYPSNISIQGDANWLTCSDVCIPESAIVSLDIPVGKTQLLSSDSSKIDTLINSAPSHRVTALVKSRDNGRLVLEAIPYSGPDIQSISFFPNDESGAILSSEISWSVQDGYLILEYDYDPDLLGSVLDALVVINSDIAFYIDAMLDSELPSPTSDMTTETTSLWLMALFAFFGGLLLNGMPCVFPILSIKAYEMVQLSGVDQRAARRSSTLYTAGIVASFVLLAVGIRLLQSAGIAVGWGFQLQSSIFIMCLLLIFGCVASILTGLIPTPSWMLAVPGKVSGSPKTDATHGSSLVSFWTGCIAVLVATPCTAPLMAPAIGYGLSQSSAALFIIFISLGIGMATPYLLLGWVPACQRLLPKPGTWLTIFERAMGWLMWAAVAWLFWVFIQLVSAGQLALCLAGFWAIGVCLWASQHSQGVRKQVIVLVIWGLIFGLGWSLRPQVDSEKVGSSTPMSSEWAELTSPFSLSQIDQFRQEGRPVFVDVTAAWCLTCKVNDINVIHTPEMLAYFQDREIEFMIADWTEYDPVITEYLQSFQRQGVPVYVFYPPMGDPVVLPSILTKSLVKNTLDPFFE